MPPWSNSILLILLGLSLGPLWNRLSSTPCDASSVLKPSDSRPVELNPVQEAVHAFRGYKTIALERNARRRAKYQKLSLNHTIITERINYTQKLFDVERAIDETAHFAEQVAHNTKQAHPGLKFDFDLNDTSFQIEYRQVQSELGHLVRDWSREGEAEREKLLKPILNTLRKEFPIDGFGKHILVPGSGLGRLAHELSKLQGWNVDMAEVSQFAIQTYNFLLNRTTHTHQYTIYPWATDWQHQRSVEDMIAPITIPDVLPNASNVQLIEGDFTQSLLDPAYAQKYNAVVTLYFIDTARNFLDYCETIQRVLKPGGLWINLGPLKWGAYGSLQLTAEEVLRLVEITGFDIDPASKMEEQNVYGHQEQALLRFTYITQFWSAKKRGSKATNT